MLLSIATTMQPATDLGYLLHKHPDRVQTFNLGFGQAHVFFPRAEPDGCEVNLLLDVDPVAVIRGGGRDSGYMADQYVNDRPYVASSLMSNAISRVFGTAMSGRCPDRQELAASAIPLVARLESLPIRGDSGFLTRVFEPLGYKVDSVRHPLDTRFPEWGESPYHRVTLSGSKTLSQLLTHLYVLIPVFDNQKHYFIGQDEMEKLLAKGADWLAGHPEKEPIAQRYLKQRRSLIEQALERLEVSPIDSGSEPADSGSDPAETGTKPIAENDLEKPISLNRQRYEAVIPVVVNSGATSVIDLGCGEGKLLRQLMQLKNLTRIVGVDVSVRSLEIAHRQLKLDRLPERQRARIELLHGSLMYRDKRMSGFDVATVVEVIEHLDPPRLAAFERVVFEFARAKTVVVTTPNREYNGVWATLPAGQFRHPDHRFEWSRQEFQDWANRIAMAFGYRVHFVPIGPVDESLGSPTQMAVFDLKDALDGE